MVYTIHMYIQVIFLVYAPCGSIRFFTWFFFIFTVFILYFAIQRSEAISWLHIILAKTVACSIICSLSIIIVQNNDRFYIYIIDMDEVRS